MAENSAISWTDHTFNGWEGCTKISPGCSHCYAETRNHRYGMDNWGKGKPRRRTSAANWKQPLKWNRWVTGTCSKCAKEYQLRAPSIECFFQPADSVCVCGQKLTITKQRVFCASLSDWLDDEVPIEWLADLLKLIHDTPNLDWLLLTKRPENWHERLLEAARHWDRTVHIDIASWLYWWTDISGSGRATENVWVGCSVENQECADKRIPELLKIPAEVRFLSCEPLLGPVNLTGNDKGEVWPWAEANAKGEGIDWVICGGESGPKARPMEIEWARSLADQCAAAGVAFFVKQDSGPRAGMRGRIPDELWVQEFPV